MTLALPASLPIQHGSWSTVVFASSGDGELCRCGSVISARNFVVSAAKPLPCWVVAVSASALVVGFALWKELGAFDGDDCFDPEGIGIVTRFSSEAPRFQCLLL